MVRDGMQIGTGNVPITDGERHRAALRRVPAIKKPEITRVIIDLWPLRQICCIFDDGPIHDQFYETHARGLFPRLGRNEPREIPRNWEVVGSRALGSDDYGLYSVLDGRGPTGVRPGHQFDICVSLREAQGFWRSVRTGPGVAQILVETKGRPERHFLITPRTSGSARHFQPKHSRRSARGEVAAIFYSAGPWAHHGGIHVQRFVKDCGRGKPQSIPFQGNPARATKNRPAPRAWNG